VDATLYYAISYFRETQRPIVVNTNLVETNASTITKEYENGNKQDSKYFQSRWCPLGLSHTHKRQANVKTWIYAAVS
jgi:hypothetical protein